MMPERLCALFLLISSGAAFLHGQGTTNGTRFIFIGHHKTGTFLSYGLAGVLENALGLPHSGYVWYKHVLDNELPYMCPRKGLSLATPFMEMGIPALENLEENCSDFRAVSFIRNFRDILVSSYIYNSNLQITDDMLPLVYQGWLLKQNSMEWGLVHLCRFWRSYHWPNMIAVYEKAPPNVMTVRFEDVENHFDGTMRSMFEFLLGRDHVKLPVVLAESRRHDVSRWNQTQRENNFHLTRRQDKLEVQKVLDRLVGEGAECVRELDALSRRLGYGA